MPENYIEDFQSASADLIQEGLVQSSIQTNAPSPEDVVAGPENEIGLGQHLAARWQSGSVAIPEMLGHGTAALGTQLGMPAVESVGERFAQFFEESRLVDAPVFGVDPTLEAGPADTRLKRFGGAVSEMLPLTVAIVGTGAAAGAGATAAGLGQSAARTGNASTLLRYLTKTPAGASPTQAAAQAATQRVAGQLGAGATGFLTQAGATRKDSLERGMSKEDAALAGIGAGAVTAIANAPFMDIVFGTKSKIISQAMQTSRATTMLVGAVTEAVTEAGIEEPLHAIIQNLVDKEHAPGVAETLTAMYDVLGPAAFVGALLPGATWSYSNPYEAMATLQRQGQAAINEQLEEEGTPKDADSNEQARQFIAGQFEEKLGGANSAPRKASNKRIHNRMKAADDFVLKNEEAIIKEWDEAPESVRGEQPYDIIPNEDPNLPPTKRLTNAAIAREKDTFLAQKVQEAEDAQSDAISRKARATELEEDPAAADAEIEKAALQLLEAKKARLDMRAANPAIFTEEAEATLTKAEINSAVDILNTAIKSGELEKKKQDFIAKISVLQKNIGKLKKVEPKSKPAQKPLKPEHSAAEHRQLQEAMAKAGVTLANLRTKLDKAADKAKYDEAVATLQKLVDEGNYTAWQELIKTYESDIDITTKALADLEKRLDANKKATKKLNEDIGKVKTKEAKDRDKQRGRAINVIHAAYKKVGATLSDPLTPELQEKIIAELEEKEINLREKHGFDEEVRKQRGEVSLVTNTIREQWRDVHRATQIQNDYFYNMGMNLYEDAEFEQVFGTIDEDAIVDEDAAIYEDTDEFVYDEAEEDPDVLETSPVIDDKSIYPREVGQRRKPRTSLVEVPENFDRQSNNTIKKLQQALNISRAEAKLLVDPPANIDEEQRLSDAQIFALANPGRINQDVSGQSEEIVSANELSEVVQDYAARRETIIQLRERFWQLANDAGKLEAQAKQRGLTPEQRADLRAKKEEALKEAQILEDQAIGLSHANALIEAEVPGTAFLAGDRAIINGRRVTVRLASKTGKSFTSPKRRGKGSRLGGRKKRRIKERQSLPKFLAELTGFTGMYDKVFRDIADGKIRIDVGAATILKDMGLFAGFEVNKNGLIDITLPPKSEASMDNDALRVYSMMLSEMIPVMEAEKGVRFRKRLEHIGQADQMNAAEFKQYFDKELATSGSMLNKLMKAFKQLEKDAQASGQELQLSHQHIEYGLQILWARATNWAAMKGADPNDYLKKSFYKHTRADGGEQVGFNFMPDDNYDFLREIDQEGRIEGDAAAALISFVDNIQAMISLGKDSTTGDFLHELGHLFRQDIFSDSDLSKHQQVIIDWVRNEVGQNSITRKIDENGDAYWEWSTEADEYFANSYVEWVEKSKGSQKAFPKTTIEFFRKFRMWVRGFTDAGGHQAHMPAEVRQTLYSLFYVPVKLSPKGAMLETRINARSGKFDLNPAAFSTLPGQEHRLLDSIIQDRTREKRTAEDMVNAGVAILIDHRSKVVLESREARPPLELIYEEMRNTLESNSMNPDADFIIAWNMLRRAMTTAIAQKTLETSRQSEIEAILEEMNETTAQMHSEIGLALKAIDISYRHDAMIQAFIDIDTKIHRSEQASMASAAMRLVDEPSAQNIHDFQKRLSHASNASTGFDVFKGLVYSGRLAGPRTMIQNASTTSAYAYFNAVPHKALSAVVDASISGVYKAVTGRTRERSLYIGEIKEAHSALNKDESGGVISTAFEEFMSVLTTGEGTGKFTGLQGKVEQEMTTASLEAIKYAPETYFGFTNDATKHLSKFLRDNANILSAGSRMARAVDVYILIIAQEGHFRALTYRAIQNKVKRGDIPQSRMQEELAKLRARKDSDLMEQAQKLAHRDTFTDRLGSHAGAVNRFRQNSRFGFFLIPFFGTLVNLSKRSLEMAPGALVTAGLAAGGPGALALSLSSAAIATAVPGQGAAAKIAEHYAGKGNLPFHVDSWSELIARQMQGAAAALALLTMFGSAEDDPENPELPKLTGAWPKDQKMSDMWKDLGIQPYSVRIGDRYVDYNHLEPLGAPLAAVAQLWDTFNELKEAEKDPNVDYSEAYIEAFMNTSWQLIPYAAKNGFSSQMLNVGQGLSDSDGIKLSKIMAREVGSWVPLSGFTSTIHRMGLYALSDEYQERKFEQSELEKMAELAVFKIPIAGALFTQHLRSDEEAEFSVFGETRKVHSRNYLNLFVPNYSHVVDPDDVEKKLAQIGWYPGIPYKDRQLPLEVKGEPLRLPIPPEMYKEYIIDYGLKAKKAIGRTIESQRFKRLELEGTFKAKYQMIEMLSESVRRATKSRTEWLKRQVKSKQRRGEIQPKGRQLVL